MNRGQEIRVILINRDETALAGLEELLAEIGATVVTGKYTEMLEALHALEIGAQGAADLIILDILTPGLDGLAAARRFKQHSEGVEIVFVTDHPDYALEAFRIHALDYLLRPVSRERLERTLARLPSRGP